MITESEFVGKYGLGEDADGPLADQAEAAVWLLLRRC
jgi:hypothetical protein